ncbi:MAG TPA: hypothetical protein VFW76_03525 [Ktedonobacterales bacterium]|nr:hypothetical protein [Ktedonobacterales bacterium]
MTRRAIPLASLLTALAFIALLAGCGAPGAGSASATATTAPTATPMLNASYTSTDGVYKVSYPGAWKAGSLTIASTSGTAQIQSNDGNELVLIEPFTFKSTAGYPSILRSAIKSSPFTNSAVDSATTTQTYPSGSWTVASGTTAANGTPLSVRLYGMLHNDQTFIVMVFAPTSSAATAQATYFDPILTSLTFLK